jgi:hypothetical protein
MGGGGGGGGGGHNAQFHEPEIQYKCVKPSLCKSGGTVQVPGGCEAGSSGDCFGDGNLSQNIFVSMPLTILRASFLNKLQNKHQRNNVDETSFAPQTFARACGPPTLCRSGYQRIAQQANGFADGVRTSVQRLGMYVYI